MICPNKPECRTHHCSAFQCLKPQPSGMAISMETLSGTRRDAMMAEIERLVDEYGTAVLTFDEEYQTAGDIVGAEKKRDSARAALLAAIERMVK